MAHTATTIELEGVGRRFGERAALRDVSAAVPAGVTLAVLGPNGAGKSTLLRVLAGLLRAHAGRVEVRGRVGLLAHEPMLYRELTPRENLRFHARLHAVAPARVDELLDAVGMLRRADDPVAELSRGMVQRVAVARAVLHDPEVLLLDEPYANLDPGAVGLVEPLVGRASGRTRVVTSHDPAAALADADLVLGLRAGRVALSGAAADVDPARARALYG